MDIHGIAWNLIGFILFILMAFNSLSIFKKAKQEHKSPDANRVRLMLLSGTAYLVLSIAIFVSVIMNLAS
jgi:uncharacterized membrane protein